MYHVKCYRPSTDSICWVEIHTVANQCIAMKAAQNMLNANAKSVPASQWVACHCGEREREQC